MEARTAPDRQAQLIIVRQHAAGSREVVSQSASCPAGVARRFSRAISCGDRTPSMIAGMSWAGFRLRPRERQLFGSLPGMAMRPFIMAAGMWKPLIRLASN
jgi:hypothetical protein